MLEDGKCFRFEWQMLKKWAGLAPRRVFMQTSTAGDEGEPSCARPDRRVHDGSREVRGAGESGPQVSKIVSLVTATDTKGV